jgi:hypothetical protein
MERYILYCYADTTRSANYFNFFAKEKFEQKLSQIINEEFIIKKGMITKF